MSATVTTLVTLIQNWDSTLCRLNIGIKGKLYILIYKISSILICIIVTSIHFKKVLFILYLKRFYAIYILMTILDTLKLCIFHVQITHLYLEPSSAVFYIDKIESMLSQIYGIIQCHRCLCKCEVSFCNYRKQTLSFLYWLYILLNWQEITFSVMYPLLLIKYAFLPPLYYYNYHLHSPDAFLFTKVNIFFRIFKF